jgi:hypothetical protein
MCHCITNYYCAIFYKTHVLYALPQNIINVSLHYKLLLCHILQDARSTPKYNKCVTALQTIIVPYFSRRTCSTPNYKKCVTALQTIIVPYFTRRTCSTPNYKKCVTALQIINVSLYYELLLCHIFRRT